MAYEHIIYETLRPVARIWHNRPAQRNAEGTQLLDELDHALHEALDDAGVKVIIIAGKGDQFSAGHDIKEGLALRGNQTVEERYAYEERRYYDYCLRIWDAPKPTIAQVHGACIAGAFMLANMCDLLVASEDAYFADPVVKGFGAAATEVLVHPWVLGLRKAKYMLYTGKPISAKEGYDIGLVSELVPRAELEAATLALAETIAQAPAMALKLTKRALNRTADIQGFRNALNAHFDTHQLSHATEAMRTALGAKKGG